MPTLAVIDRSGEQRSIDVCDGDPLMIALRDADFGIEATCDGGGICATCHVYLEAGWDESLPEADVFEEMQLEGLVHRQGNSRLACQILVSDAVEGCTVRIAPEEI